MVMDISDTVPRRGHRPTTQVLLTNTLGKGLSATQAFAEAADVRGRPATLRDGDHRRARGGSGTLRWTSAGQHPPLILRADDQPEWLAPPDRSCPPSAAPGRLRRPTSPRRCSALLHGRPGGEPGRARPRIGGRLVRMVHCRVARAARPPPGSSRTLRETASSAKRASDRQNCAEMT